MTQENKINKKVHVVPHTHWDVEWYFDIERSNALLLNNIDSIITTLEKDSDFKYYTLDGQTVLLDIYLKYRPENFNRIKKLVKSRKLLIGPWYTQTNQTFVHGEALVRNLQYGIKDSQIFGGHMSVGYIPDSFGQTEQLPQILNNFNIDKAVFWRGVSEENSKNLTFNWNHISNKYSVQAVNIRFGYALGKYLPTESTKIQKRLHEIFKKQDPYVGDHDYVLGNGHDQMPIQVDLVAALRAINEQSKAEFQISNFDKFIKDQDFEKAINYQGELNSSQFSRIHRTMISTRMDIKIAAAQLENRMLNIIEPLSVLAAKLNINPERTLIADMWKELMVNNSHDSLGGCVSDDVTKNIMQRFDKVRRMMDGYEEIIKRQIVVAINNSKLAESFLALNLLPWSQKRYYEATVYSRYKHIKVVDGKRKLNVKYLSSKECDKGFVNKRLRVFKDITYFEHKFILEDTIPAFGYKAYEICEADSVEMLKPKKLSFLESDKYKISFNKNGTINIEDKKLGKEFKNQLSLISEPDVGDTYDYSPDEKYVVVNSKKVTSKVEVKDYDSYQEAVISYEWLLPKNIDERNKGVASAKDEVEIKVRLDKITNLINFNFKIDNKANDQRMRLILDTDVKATEVNSNQSFGTIARSIENLEKANWVEKFVPVYPFINALSVNGDQYTFAVTSNSLRGYEFIDSTKLALTVIRSIGYLGKSDLPWRPGRSSGLPFETPDAQINKEIEFNLSIGVFGGKISHATINNEFKVEQTNNVWSAKRRDMEFNLNTDITNKKLPMSLSLFELSTKQLSLETIKLKEGNNKVVVRMSNPLRKVIKNDVVFTGLNFSLFKMDEQTKIKNSDSIDPLEVLTWVETK